MIATDMLRRNAELYGEDVALVELNPAIPATSECWSEYDLVATIPVHRHRREITWKSFDEVANRTGQALMARGIKKGQKVAILLMNCVEWLPIYFGILKTGAVAVPLNFRYDAEEIRYCLDVSDAEALVFGSEFVERMDIIKDKIPKVKTLIFMEDEGDVCPAFAESFHQLINDYPPVDPKIPITPDDDGAIYFSSGTTGFPKAILHHHSSLTAGAETEVNHHGQTREDTFLCIPPLYHTGAKIHWFGSLLSGGKAVLLRGVKPEWILQAVSQEKATIVWLLVPWVQDIVDAFDRGDLNPADYELDQWRLMHIGAQPVPPSLVKHWKEYFPHHLFDNNYGLSESMGPGCVHLGVENIHKVGAIGKAGYKWEARIIDEDGNVVPEGKAGVVGELTVRGHGLMVCYYNNPEATAETLKDGWLYTGDMAEYDEDGFIYLVDRKKDVIISGGENIYPVQIEDFLHSNEHINDVAVIGLPDKRLGEITAAVIEVKQGHTLTEEQVNEFCMQLPRYKRPRKVIFADVPRNGTGKIEKPKLREMYGAARLVAQQNELN